MNIFTGNFQRVNCAWKQARAIILLVICILFALPVLSFSQSQYEQEQKKELEKLFTERAYDCNDIYKNCTRLIADYYAKGDLDSVRVVVNYWQSTCYGAASLVRFQTLFWMQSETAPLVMAPNILLRSLRYYKWYYAYGDRERREYRDSHQERFDKLVDSLATNALKKAEPHSLEHHIARIYCGEPDSLYHFLQVEPGANTPLGQEYRRFADSVRYAPEEYFGLSSGAWVPVGKRELLGVKPLLSFFTGHRWNRYLIELYMGIAFLQSKSPYVVKAGDSLIETEDFNCGMFGFELGRELLRTQHHEFDAMVGAGAQVVNAIYVDDEKYKDGKQYWSALGTVGVRYRLYPVKYNSTFIYFQPMLEFSTINTEGGTDLSGAAITFRLGVSFRGFYSTKEKQQVLREMEYEY